MIWTWRQRLRGIGMNNYHVTIERTYTIRAESEERAVQRMREMLEFAGYRPKDVNIVRCRFLCEEDDR